MSKLFKFKLVSTIFTHIMVITVIIRAVITDKFILYGWVLAFIAGYMLVSTIEQYKKEKGA